MENSAEAAELKKMIKTACREDFEVLKNDLENGDIEYVVSLFGVCDLAWFLRKADAETFKNTFPVETQG